MALAVSVAILILLQMLLTPKYMEHSPEGTLIGEYYENAGGNDVIFIGDCEVYENFSPITLWEEYGIPSCIRGSAQQTIWQSYYLMEETFRYETPKVMVFNVLSMKYDTPESTGSQSRREAYNRMTLDTMKWSPSKWNAILASMTEEEKQWDSMVTYLFPVLRYHDRWKDINLAEDKPEPLLEHSFKKGNVYLREIAPQSYPERFMQPTGVEDPEFNIYAKPYVERSIALCKEKGIPVLLLHLPKMSWTYEHSRALESFALENGAYYLDLDRAEYKEVLQLDPQVDYYDQGHMNLTGLVKVSDYLGDWLDISFDLPDHRNDPAISESWNRDMTEYMERTGVLQ